MLKKGHFEEKEIPDSGGALIGGSSFLDGGEKNGSAKGKTVGRKKKKDEIRLENSRRVGRISKVCRKGERGVVL